MARRRWLRLGKVALALLAAPLGAVTAATVGAHVVIALAAAGVVSGRLSELPERPVALVLGTSPRGADGAANPYFAARVAAAADLYRAGKVQRILVSGSSASRWYNEARTMRQGLEARGVPAGAILEDDQAPRTYDSVRRAREVFGLRAVTIVSQPAHVRRAVFLARAAGLEAGGYAAAGRGWATPPRMIVREIGAGVRAVWDAWVWTPAGAQR